MDIDFMDNEDYLQEIDRLYLSWKNDDEGYTLFADYLESKGYSDEYEDPQATDDDLAEYK